MTEKQLKWQKRSRILWRLKGMVGFPFEEGVLTSLEHERLNVAFSIIRGVVQDSVESSIELGFNAKRRCTFGVCRKPAIEGSEYCREHKDSIVPLQESIYEDAKDLEKKKTVDEGTTVVTYKKVYKFVRT